MIASVAITTGLFVLAGVVVGGLLTGGVNYALERLRKRASGRVAVRLLDAELSIAGASAQWRLQQGAWSPWDFEHAHRTWDEYRPDVARVLSTDEWTSVALGFYAISVVEQRFFNKPLAAKLDRDEIGALKRAADSLYEAVNTLRKRQGLEEIIDPRGK